MLTLLGHRLLSTLTTMLLLAAPDGAEDRPPRPPREAIEACEGADPGDPCAFEGREGEEVEGSCWRPDTDKPLACRPAHPHPR